jgi:hypothetical protein
LTFDVVFLVRSVYVGRGCLEQAIEFCRSNGLVIVGMEGVKTDGSAIMPTIEFIADLSEIDGQWQERVVASFDAAGLIAAQWSGLTGFDVVEFEVAAE